MLQQVSLAGLAMLIAATLDARADAPSNQGGILVVGPEMQLATRSAAGDALTRPDWSRTAQQNVRHCLEDRLRASSRPFQFVDPRALMQGRSGQLLRLHAVVADAALDATRQRGAGRPRWSIGPGAQELADAYHADYALILGGDGIYASAPSEVIAFASNLRTAASAATGNASAAAALGLHALHLGGNGRRMLASLVDLHSGDIIWIRQLNGSDDPRTPEGARSLVRALLRNSPL